MSKKWWFSGFFGVEIGLKGCFFGLSSRILCTGVTDSLVPAQAPRGLPEAGMRVMQVYAGAK